MEQTEQTVQSYVNTIAERIKSQSKHTDHLNTNCSVRLRKLFRSMNDSDRYGYFSPITGAWQDIDSSQLYSINIVKPTIRTNTSAMQTANVKVDILPRFLKDSRSEMASQVGRSILEQKERLQWTDFVEQSLAMEQQMGAGVFIRTFHDKTKKRTHRLPKWETEEVEMPGVAICTQCGAESPISGEVELDEPVPCQACGGVAMVQGMPTTEDFDVETGYSEFTSGDTCTEILPFFEFRVDDLETQGGNLKKAKWFEHHYYASVDELQLEYPEANITPMTTDVSYPLRWQQALKRNYTAPSSIATESVVEQTEVRDIFLTPVMYLNHPFSEDFALKDKDGKVRFSVKKGKTFGDAEYEGEKLENPVVCVKLVDTSVVDIYECDFREEYEYVSFLSNPSAFWGLFLYEVVALQDIITYVISLQFYHVKRNAITSIIYNRNSFDAEEFGKDLIPTKQQLPFDIPINSQFGVVPALALSGEPMQLYQMMMESMTSVTLATPAMQGQAQPNEPYHAQLLQKQSSLGLLAPAETSKAQAKVGWAKQQLRLVRKFWTEEDTEELLQLNPEWTEDFITAFLECDLDRDLMIDYKQGTEIPQSLIEREVKLQNLLQQVMMVGQIDPSFVQTDALKEIMAELIQSTGLDIDVGNNESNMRLAESRYDKLVTLLTGVPETENIEIMNLVTDQVLQLPAFQPLEQEDYGIIIEFYADKARNEASRENPNWLLLLSLQKMIAMEKQASTGAQQEAMMQQMQAGAPMMEAQQQMAQAEEEQRVQSELMLKEADVNDPTTQMQFDNDERQRQHDSQIQDKELADNEKERQARIQQAKLQNQRAAKTASKGAKK